MTVQTVLFSFYLLIYCLLYAMICHRTFEVSTQHFMGNFSFQGSSVVSRLLKSGLKASRFKNMVSRCQRRSRTVPVRAQEEGRVVTEQLEHQQNGAKRHHFELLSVWGIMGHHNLQQTFKGHLKEFELLTHTVIPCCSGLRSAPYGSQIPLSFFFFFLFFKYCSPIYLQ